jgi:two-component system cell cycle response regulator DivK
MAKKVLIVEDNELNMKLFHDLLEAQGYETLETREGLRRCRLRAGAPPDLILMDIQLPRSRGSSHQVAERGRTLWPKSRWWRHRLRHEGRRGADPEGGCEAYISKPIPVSHFLETIRRLLN